MDDLNRKQWSSAWISVMKSLRTGVTLRRVEDYTEVKKRHEFEFSAYEMLLDDIRKKTYQLKKVPEVPDNLKKDTHDIILGMVDKVKHGRFLTDKLKFLLKSQKRINQNV